MEPLPSIVQNTLPTDLEEGATFLRSSHWSYGDWRGEAVVIPSGNVGEVSCAKAAPEQLTAVTIKPLYWKIFLLMKERKQKTTTMRLEGGVGGQQVT